jgi:hypothetical protein
MTGALVLLGSLLLAPPGRDAASDVELFEQATGDFHAGLATKDNPTEAKPLFRRAAAGFQELCDRGVGDADLYLNQGNAALLAGNLPRAILAYRQGLALSPADSSLRENLRYARVQVAVAQPGGFGATMSQENRWIGCLRSWATEVGMAAFVLYSLGWIIVMRWWITRQPGLLAVAIGALVLSLLIASVPIIDHRQRADESHYPLVVIAVDRVRLRTGNGPNYPPRYSSPLNRGVEARLISTRNGWLQIELVGGEIGWIRNSQAWVSS